MSTTSFEVYKDKKGHYRWRLVARNGENVAEGGEGFVDRRHAMNAVKKLKVWASTEKIIDKTMPAVAPKKAVKAAK
jgi:uncharacterized protein YegP (UPF0339 family)